MQIFNFSLMGCAFFSCLAIAGVDIPIIPNIKEVYLNPEHVYVPKGFDSNDISEVIVTGWYPNPCYEWSRSIVEKAGSRIDIDLKAFVKDGGDSVCIDMAVPYMESIKLGQLREGYSRISVEDIDTSIHVAIPGSSAIDNYIYGKVNHVRTEGNSLILEIERPSPCIELDEFKTVFNGIDTCAVLPIMKQVSSECPRKIQTLEYRYEIPEEYLIQEKTLFHIRSLGGKSVNHLFRNKDN